MLKFTLTLVLIAVDNTWQFVKDCDLSMKFSMQKLAHKTPRKYKHAVLNMVKELVVSWSYRDTMHWMPSLKHCAVRPSIHSIKSNEMKSHDFKLVCKCQP